MHQRFAAVLLAAAFGASVVSSGRVAAQQSAPQKNAVTIVQVRPEAVPAWREFQATQTVPALRKAGVAQRDVYEPIYAPAGQFRVVQPLAKFADRDNPQPPIAVALGEAAFRTYGEALSNPQPDAPEGPAPPTNPQPSPGGPAPSGGGSGAPAKARAALQGTPTSARGAAFVVTMPAAGTARIVIQRARSANTFRSVGTVNVRLKQGRNVVRVKRVKRRKLAKGSYRATITPKVGSQSLAPVVVKFKIRR